MYQEFKTDLFKQEREIYETHVVSLVIDHALSAREITDFKYFMLHAKGIESITFEKVIDVKTIKAVKELLEASTLPNINDKKIKKFIYNEPISEVKELLYTIKTEHPDTWRMCYCNQTVREMATLEICQEADVVIKSVVDKIKGKNLSPFEIILWIYDIVKCLKYRASRKTGRETSKLQRLSNVIISNTANCYGYTALFRQLVSEFGLKGLEVVTQIDSVEYSRVVMEITDPKYKIAGIYLFDPTFDSLPIKKYSDPYVRMMPYDYFSIPIMDSVKLEESKPSGMYAFLTSSDFEDSFSIYQGLRRVEQKLLKDFFSLNSESMIVEFYNKIQNTKLIDAKSFRDMLTAVRYAQYRGSLKDSDILRMVRETCQKREENLHTNFDN